MAKQLLINKQNGKAAYADTGTKLSKLILLNEIEMHPDFQKLFKIDENLLSRITESMAKGFDNSQPLHIWLVIDEDGTKHFYLIDGYTRYTAALRNNLTAVPYFEHIFNSFDEAYKYVLGLQVNRRNLEGSELLKNISILMGTEFIQNSEGKKTEAIAEVLDVSPRTVAKAIAVEKDDDAKEEVESGKATINQAYKKLQEKKKKESKKEDELPESLSDNTENPGSLNFNHSDGIERPIHDSTEEDELDEWTKEKNIQVENAEKKGFSAGIYKGIYFALGEILKGRTPEEIINDERITDFSPTVIFNFELPSEDEDLVNGLL